MGSDDPSHLEQIQAHADRLDQELEVGLASICKPSQRFEPEHGTPVEQLRRMLQVARRLDSPIVRCFLGNAKDRGGPTPLEQHIENTIKSCKAVRSEALDLGLKIAIENHAGDLQSHQLRMLIEEAGPEYVGALYDAGNAAWTLEDPLLALETLAPHILTSGIRDSAIWEVPEGAAVQWVAMGAGNVDIDQVARRYAELCPDKVFSLEIINTRTPRTFAYWNESFWENYRDVPAGVFTHFLRRARSGSPYENVPAGPSDTAPDSPTFKQFLVDPERRDVEQAVDYCRNHLGFGRE